MFKAGLRGEAVRFLLVGGGAALLDLASYLLLRFAGLPTPIAKGCSFALAASAAYFGNKHFTYRRDITSKASVLLYALLYTCTLGLNVIINDGVLHVLHQKDSYEIAAAWFIATAISAGVNFLGTKLVIFRGQHLS
jgi:putative flippase GtrA